MYQKRKDFLVGMLGAEVDKLSNQARFILEKCTGKLTVENKKRKAMIEELISKGYEPDPVKAWKKKSAADEEEEEAEDDTEDTVQTTSSKKPVDPGINNYFFSLLWGEIQFILKTQHIILIFEYSYAGMQI